MLCCNHCYNQPDLFFVWGFGGILVFCLLVFDPSCKYVLSSKELERIWWSATVFASRVHQLITICAGLLEFGHYWGPYEKRNLGLQLQSSRTLPCHGNTFTSLEGSPGSPIVCNLGSPLVSTRSFLTKHWCQPSPYPRSVAINISG